MSNCWGGHVPFGPVNNIEEIMEDDHVKERKIIQEIRASR